MRDIEIHELVYQLAKGYGGSGVPADHEERQQMLSELGAELPYAKDQDKARALLSMTQKFDFMGGDQYVKEGRIANFGWLLKNLIPDTGLVQIVGKQKAGKTQVTLDLALSVANESVEDWYGYKIKHGTVYYVILEGTAFFHRRVEAWLKVNGGNLDNFFIWDKPISLASQTDILGLALGAVEKPALLVIDSQYMATQGLNENDAEDMGVVFGNLVWLSKALETVVIPVHHTGLTVTDRARGHSVQAAAVQATLVVQKGKRRRTIKINDVREAEEPEEPFYFTVESVPLGYSDDDGPVSSAVAIHQDAPSKSVVVADCIRDGIDDGELIREALEASEDGTLTTTELGVALGGEARTRNDRVRLAAEAGVIGPVVGQRGRWSLRSA